MPIAAKSNNNKIKDKRMNAKKGFTLIEIMIVVAIIAILAAIAIPNFISYRKTSQMNACIANLKALDNATEAYRIRQNDSTACPKLSDLVKAGDSSGKYYFNKSVKCPAGGTYTPATTSEGWKCSVDADGFKHAVNTDAK